MSLCNIYQSSELHCPVCLFPISPRLEYLKQVNKRLIGKLNISPVTFKWAQDLCCLVRLSSSEIVQVAVKTGSDWGEYHVINPTRLDTEVLDTLKQSYSYDREENPLNDYSNGELVYQK